VSTADLDLAAPTAAAAAGAAPPPAAAELEPAAPAGEALPSFDAAERYLLQQMRVQLQPGADQLLRFRRAMQQLGRLQAGDPKLDRFWADYEVSWFGCATCLAAML
jgi:hypothetical protein